ncbi:MAG: hypothetical protein IH840_00035 [Candidatus Heimdallarchaeota archaeon]|nr:hypothetical protein [Candidatus Heimdallarchaeota archaeon]
MTTYNFESSDEGFALTGEGSLTHTFPEWVTPTKGFNDYYSFEFNTQGYSLTQSINAYAVLEVTELITTKQVRIKNMVERRLLERVDFIDDIYDISRFRGEVR